MKIKDIEDKLVNKYGGEELFRKSYELAKYLHRNQPRSDGSPYFHHLARVAYRVMDVSLHAVVIALLHDSVEDGHITFKQLIEMGIPSSIIDSIDDLSRRKHETESYFAFILRVLNSGRQLSIIVKLADLEDNMSDSKEGARLDKYRLSHYILGEKCEYATIKL